jgi:hypothetical protein
MGGPMTPASVTPVIRTVPANPPIAGLAPDRVIEIEARLGRSRDDAAPAMTESRLAELAASIRLR